MALKFSDTVRNARADAVETAIGTTPIIKIRTGAEPAGIGSADSGTVLASITLPSDWLAAAASGVKAKLGTWTTTGLAAGTAGHFRLYASDGVTVHAQGDVTITGGGGVMTVDNTSIAVSQPVTVTTFQWTEGNA